MNNKNNLLAGAALLAALFVAPVLTSTSAQAYQCASSGHSATRYAKTRSAALVSSRFLWSSMAKNRLGQAWSVWNIAKSRSTRCKRTHSKPGSNWKCTRRAVPCLYVVQ